MNTVTKEKVYTFKPYMKGMNVSCNIRATQIDDAKIQFENDYYYICQNVMQGNNCKDKLGYAYSYTINEGDDEGIHSNSVSDILVWANEWDDDSN